ncbi:MAG: CoA-substrate-specific enzyme activase [Caldanaerobacter subterraneus]|uniref:2-hydroxyglutaryl-CoA dehydratase n=1 Tax=Caldanaerobacter subterraneus TaxID=911092 RepID=A0A117KVK9_9THEO|nr:acyl-CoA dehydratase activase [Caldanaerobacter subterraneus]KUK08380.1 MAG: CoA-substrate-specific enzyme activase [Caldanaerobacter subterraneus]HBT48544.1 2-hydroxyglutaryl-CoA dehydratase [Caldanaerobacter subterraneus]
MEGYMGIDVGSVSTNIAVIDEENNVIDYVYIRTRGQPIKAVQEALREIKEKIGDVEIKGVGTTGSARQLTGLMVGADIVKNEITAHAVAASSIVKDVRTVIEIGGQDSKIIILRNGVVVDFAMNTVCAAGTGSFLDQQAYRLNIPIEEFGDLALKSKNPVRIGGRCSVFAESDMIHKQQMGYALPDIISGLCDALVRNYLNNVGKGKDIKEPIVFQGGVAANKGIKAAFEKALGMKVYVPKYYGVMGAIGAAILAKDAVKEKGYTLFKGFEVSDLEYKALGFECTACPNHCEVVEFIQGDEVISRWGDKCGRWSNSPSKKIHAGSIV